MSHSLFEDSPGLEVDEGQRSFVQAAVEDEDVADDDLVRFLSAERPNFCQSRRSEAVLVVVVDDSTPALCNEIPLIQEMKERTCFADKQMWVFQVAISLQK